GPPRRRGPTRPPPPAPRPPSSPRTAGRSPRSSRPWNARRGRRGCRSFSRLGARNRGDSEGPRDGLDEASLLAQDEAPVPREVEVGERLRIGPEARPVNLVRRQRVEGAQAPGHVVGPFVRQEVTYEAAPAARNDASPVLGILAEGVALERIDLVADEAGHGHRVLPMPRVSRWRFRHALIMIKV